MPDKVTSHRIDKLIVDKVKSLWGSASKGHTMADYAYVSLRPYVIEEIEEHYSTAMIAVTAEALQNSAFDHSFASSQQVLISKLKQHKNNVNDPSKKSNLVMVMERIRTSSPIECYFLQEEIHRRTTRK